MDTTQIQIATRTATSLSWNDTDDEIAAAETEEEWIEYMKRSTEAAIEQMKIAKIPLLDRNKRMKWRLAMRIASMSEERWARESSGMEPWPQHKIQNLQSRGKTEKDGKTKSMNFSERKESNNNARETTMCGSRQ